MKFSHRKILDYVGLFAVYCAISLSVGEQHPFSRFPMYNSFPNWSYAFYLTDVSGEMIPWWHAFEVDAGHIAHRFYGICQHYGIAYGHGMETEEELKFIGTELLKSVDGKCRLSYDSELHLFRRHFFFEEGSLMHHDVQMSAMHVGSAEPGDVPTTLSNTAKLHGLIGLKPKTPLEEGLRKTVEWYNSFKKLTI